MPPGRVPVLVITGPVGVGKTTVGLEVSGQLDQASVAHAFVDVDALRWCYPRPTGDRFRAALAMQNLAAIWPNFQRAGARRLVLADVLESRAELRRIETAVPGAGVRVVRLRASPSALAARVQQREQGLARGRLVERAAELAQLMDRVQVEDLLVQTDERTISELASEIVSWSGWLASAHD